MSAQGVPVCVANHTHIKMARRKSLEKLYFCMGVLVGAAVSSLLAMVLTTYSLKTTYYYYYYNERIYSIPDAKIQPGVFYYEDTSQEPTTVSSPPILNHHLSEEEEEARRFKAEHLLNQERQPHPYVASGVDNLVVVLVDRGREGGGASTCQISEYEDSIKDTWGNHFNNIFNVEEKRCTRREDQLLWVKKRDSFSYTYAEGDINVSNLLYRLYNKLKSKDHWILFIHPETYINKRELSQSLANYHHYDSLVFGKPVSFSPYQRRSKSLACQTGAGFVVSREVLKRLVREGQSCLTGSTSPDKIMTNITQCIGGSLAIDCSSQLPMMKDFNEDLIIRDEKVSSLRLLNRYVTISPVKSSYAFYSLHYYFTQLEYNETVYALKNIHRNVKRLLSKMAQTNPKKSSPVPGHLPSNEYPLYETAPSSMNELQTWIYFDSVHMYRDRDIDPKQNHFFMKNEIDTALLEAVRLANNEYHTPLSYHKVINGYLRHSQNGAQYILDIEFKEVYNPYVTLQRRFSLLRPFHSSFVKLPSKNLANEIINFIVPVSRVGKRLDEFFHMYEQLIPLSQNHLHLVLVVYNKDDMTKCEELISKYHRLYPSSQFSIVQGKGNFARARALDAGTSVLNDGDLMFFCDVDMDVSPGFLRRCRQNTVRNKQVYYPEVFKMYNMKYVYKLSRTPPNLPIQRKHGHWGYYSYGMLCMYKGDYTKIGGLDTSYYGWGREDLEFHQRILEYGYDILRSPDPGLIHRWHAKICNPNGQWKGDCVSSQTEVLADRKELGRYVLELEKNSSHLFCI